MAPFTPLAMRWRNGANSISRTSSIERVTVGRVMWESVAVLP